jgi:cyclic pyranopterin phosphate synthase
MNDVTQMEDPLPSTKEIRDLRHGYTLRISLPFCNLRCVYCRRDTDDMPPSDELMSDEDLIDLVVAARECGINAIRWTGGEPTMKPNFIDLVEEVKNTGIDVQMLSTNGTLMSDTIDDLHRAGIRRVNISLDTLNREKYKQTTSFDYLPRVLNVIEESADVFDLLKINTVLTRDNFEDAPDLISFVKHIKEAHSIRDDRIVIRFIELIWGGFEGDKEYVSENFVSGNDLVTKAEKVWGTLEDADIEGDNPMCHYHKIVKEDVIFGIIPHFSVNFQCGGDNCKKVRVNPTGWVSNCSIHKRFAHHIVGLPYEEKLDVLKHLILEKWRRDESTYRNLKHFQSDYHFWRFGVPSK